MKAPSLPIEIGAASPYKRRLPTVRPLKMMHCFPVLLLFIAGVSVHDTALVVLNDQVILDVERNPVARWLIEANGQSIWLFVVVKLFSTAVVCALLLSVHEQSRRLGVAVALALAAFQGTLLLHLSIH